MNPALAQEEPIIEIDEDNVVSVGSEMSFSVQNSEIDFSGARGSIDETKWYIDYRHSPGYEIQGSDIGVKRSDNYEFDVIGKYDLKAKVYFLDTSGDKMNNPSTYTEVYKVVPIPSFLPYENKPYYKNTTITFNNTSDPGPTYGYNAYEIVEKNAANDRIVGKVSHITVISDTSTSVALHSKRLDSSNYIFKNPEEIVPESPFTNEVNEPQSSNQLRAYPNPFSEKLTIEINSTKGERKIKLKIINTSGKIIEVKNGLTNKEKMILNTKSWESGVYSIQLINDGTIQETKTIVNQ